MSAGTSSSHCHDLPRLVTPNEQHGFCWFLGDFVYIDHVSCPWQMLITQRYIKPCPTGTHCLEDMEKLTVLLLHAAHCSRGKNNVWETSGGQQDPSKGYWEDPDKSLCLIVLPRGLRPFKKEKSSHWVIMRTQHPGKGRRPQWCAGSRSEP